MSDKSRVIRLWKEHKVESVIMNFSCGGDSMNDTEFHIHPEETVPKNVKEEIEAYFQDEVYKRIEFYVNSDGHYEGEAGTVTITMEKVDDSLQGEEDDDDNYDFSYDKDAEEEYNESFTEQNVEFPLTAVQKKFIQDNVSNINGGDGGIAVNFKRDFIMTDAQEEMYGKLKDKIEDFMRGREPECEYEGSLNESGPTFTTNDGDRGEQLKVVDNNLIFELHYRATVYKKNGEIVEQ